MEYVWYAVACALGLAFGLVFGRLLAAFLVHWETTDVALKATTSLVVFALGGGSGAAIFALIGVGQSGLYVLFLAAGLIGAFFWPHLPSVYTVESVRSVVRMSDALRDKIPGVEERVTTILSFLVPPKTVQKEAKISEAEQERRLEQAADAIADDKGGAAGGAPDHGQK